ncbi:JAB domain-containing protein [Neobacillus sp. 179-C4.2 HS]|uniref:JAB domain-containing protein n=1 Tax=Neobacillus driksii TaxID=3035913 RepID=A0ABV4YUF0_9BACI|nr:JAB domain-containing protein [Neobacillus sp. 179.-C4.2 HS]MDP5195058.1 JAB domain-containing protein [Neobacillus sp. 179.-C4.2 HS]
MGGAFTTEIIYEVIKINQIVREVQEELKERIYAPQQISNVIHYFIGDDDREVFLVICLSSVNNIVAVHRCHIGSLNSTTVSPRDVFKAAILNNANGIIVSHNHPSTHLYPSEEDIFVTKALMKAGKILEIPLLDHIIINSNGDYFSFKEEGFLLKDRVIRKSPRPTTVINPVFKKIHK